MIGKFGENKKGTTKYQVHCIEKKKPLDNKIDPILIKICDFKTFRSVRTGKADYKGRYSYDYQLFKITKNGKKKIKNSDLFNSGTDLVEKKINRDLRQEYEKNLNNPHLKNCMEWIDFRYYNINEMGIAFSDNNEIEFYINYGIGGACFNVSFSILNYKISEFEKYMK